MSLKPLVAVLALVAIAASGCGGASASDGNVSGVASPCVGITTTAELAAIAVRVTLSQHSKVVDTETVTGHHHFRLSARPGQYLLTSDQYQKAEFFVVVLHAGETTHVDLAVSCK